MRLPFISSLLGVLIWLCALPAQAYEIEGKIRLGANEPNRVLNIISTADRELFTPLLLSFLTSRPSIAIEYVTVSSTQLMQAIYTERATFDVAISSAMDLQTKLANDGFTRSHESTICQSIPAWARWRNHVYTFTQEPAAIVYSPDALKGLEIPETRQQLIDLLRNNQQQLHGKVGTYDIRTSGLGYLFATHDARFSDIYWRLSEVMGSLGAQLYCCSGKMIEDIENGKLAIAYNVLGSYAQARRDQGAKIEIVEPADFTTVMLRSAVIPDNANQAELAGEFIDHLLSASWQQSADTPYPFPEIKRNLDGARNAYQPIRLGPGLLVYLDDFKRRHFLREWENSMIQE